MTHPGIARLLVLCATLAAAGCASAGGGARPDPDREDWVQLFNGRDLEGWIPKIRGRPLGENYLNTFRVRDGKMVVDYSEYTDFARQYGHIFYEKPFSHYRIAVEYRFVGDQAPQGEGWARRNSGIMVHGQDPRTMGVPQDFPISIEVQLLGGLGEGKRTTANLCTPGTHVRMADTLVTTHCVNSRSETYQGDQWVRAEVLVLGDSLIRHVVNGETVLEYTHPQIGGGTVSGHDPAVKQDGRLLDSGSISLQSESHPVEFRKVELLDLQGCMDPRSPSYRSYFVKSDPSRCAR